MKTETNGNGTKTTLATINPTIATVPETLTQADRDQAMSLIAQLRDILPPLQDITAEERQTMLGMGDRNRAFAGKVLEVAQQHPDFLPRSFSIEQLAADLTSFDRLSSILMSLTQLRNLVDATVIAIGTQAYEQSLTAYRHAKVSGHGASLESMMEDMGQRFSRKPKKKEDNPPEETQPTDN